MAVEIGGPNPTNPKTVVIYRTGTLPTSDKNARDNYSKDARKAIYDICRMESRYYTIGCRTQMPIARDLGESTEEEDQQQTAVVFTLGRSQSRREIKIEFERAGRWPEILDPEDTYEDGTLEGKFLKRWIKPQPPTVSADGQQQIFRITAYYLYALNRPPTAKEKIRVGILPFTNWTAEQNSLDLSKFQKQEL